MKTEILLSLWTRVTYLRHHTAAELKESKSHAVHPASDVGIGMRKCIQLAVPFS